MKYLQDYQEERQTELFNRLGSFFAFSNEQFEKAAKPGVKYSSLGQGMITPQGTEIELIETLDKIYNESIAQDIKENGIPAIIRRELFNHEAFYTRDWGSTADALENYPIEEGEIAAAFYKIAKEENQ
jgi:hypothetical protein